jgi:hypothetical protein
LPKDVEHWSLTTLREKLIKIGAKLLKRLFVTDEFHRVLRVDGDCTFFTYRDG